MQTDAATQARIEHIFLGVERVWIRGPGTAQATVGGGDDEEPDHKVSDHVANRPCAQNEKLSGEGLGHVRRLEAVELHGHNATLSDGSGHALVKASGGTTQHDCKAK